MKVKVRTCLNIFQKNNYVIIKINEEAEYEAIKNELKHKLVQLKKIYKEEQTPIKVIGKVLKNKEIDEVEEIIKGILDVEVEFDMPREMGLSNIKRCN